MAVSRPSADRQFFRKRLKPFDQPSFERKLLLLVGGAGVSSVPKEVYGAAPKKAAPIGPGARTSLCRGLYKSKLRQSSHAVVKADLLDDHAVLKLKNGRSGEPHLASGVGWK